MQHTGSLGANNISHAPVQRTTRRYSPVRGLPPICHAQTCSSQLQQRPQTATVPVTVRVIREVALGLCIQLVGSAEELGGWDIPAGPQLKWNEGHVWTGQIALSPGTHEFKCVSASGDSSYLEWEEGPNRVLKVPETVQGLQVECLWSDTQRTAVTYPPARARDTISDSETADLVACQSQQVDNWTVRSGAASPDCATSVHQNKSSSTVPETARVSTRCADASGELAPSVQTSLEYSPSSPTSMHPADSTALASNHPSSQQSFMSASSDSNCGQPAPDVTDIVSPADTIAHDLERVLVAWDAAWAGGGTRAASTPAPRTADAPRLPYISPLKRSFSGLQDDAPPQAAAAAPAAKSQSPGRPRTAVLGSPSALDTADTTTSSPLAINNTGPAFTSRLTLPEMAQPSESLFALAERLASSPSDDLMTGCSSSPDVTMRNGALAAMSVDRPASEDARAAIQAALAATQAQAAAALSAEDLSNLPDPSPVGYLQAPEGPSSCVTASGLLIPEQYQLDDLAGPSSMPLTARAPQTNNAKANGNELLSPASVLSGLLSPEDTLDAELDLGPLGPEQGEGPAMKLLSGAATSLGSAAAKITAMLQRPTLDLNTDDGSNTLEYAAMMITTPRGADASKPPGPPQLVVPPAVAAIASNLAQGLGTGLSSFGSSLGSSLGRQLQRSSSDLAVGVSTALAIAREAMPPTDLARAASEALESVLYRDPPVTGLRLMSGVAMIPHVDKAQKGGEDAYFISQVAFGGVGVADGVSGWAGEGIDPADYPRTLMRHAMTAYEEARGVASATDIIRYSQYRTYLKGSSTVCLALMKPGNQLELANVGDSGVRVIREGQLVFSTEPQQHAFNMPYQLSHPSNVDDPDSADDADVHVLDVLPGDVIILATDGLYDNVFDEEIEEITVQKLAELGLHGQHQGRYRAEDATEVARALAERAHMHARNPTQRTPWSVSSCQQPGFMWAHFFAKGGGKMDDCTVLVAFVSE